MAKLGANRFLVQALFVALFLAVAWWFFGLVIRLSGEALVWDDQFSTFLRMRGLTQPYEVAGFVNPPWAHVILLPFKLLPLMWAVLAQMLVYFVVLVGLAFKFGDAGNRSRYAAFIILTSPFALDTALEINIEWIVGLGLLLPAAYSAPFVWVKPQIALGYVLGFARHEWLQWLLVTAGTVALSFVVWGWWLPQWYHVYQTSPVTFLINIAPMSLIGTLPSLIIGVCLAFWAFRRRDTLLGVLAGTFFVPYLAGYSAMIHFALIAARWPRYALLISVLLWLLVGLLFIG